MVSEETLRGRLPINLILNAQPASAVWAQFGATSLSEPFFDETVARLRNSIPPVREWNSDLEEIFEIADRLPPVTPAGLIFHISRCGSTLLSNALKTAEDSIVASEPTPITEIFLRPATPRASYLEESLTMARTALLLESLAKIFASYRTGTPERLIVKFASWNILSFPIIRRVWPEVPCIIVIREPLEVLISNLAKPVGWMELKSSPAEAIELFHWTGLNLDFTTMDNIEFCARVIGQFCQAAVHAIDENCRVLDYENINIHTVRESAAFFRLSLRASDDKIQRLLGTYAKDPTRSLPFKNDRQSKHQAATEALRAAADQWARASYVQLKRCKQWLSRIEGPKVIQNGPRHI